MPTNRPSSTLPPLTPIDRRVEPIPYFTLRECGEIFGCHPDNCRQAEQRAFRKIAEDLVVQRLWRDICEDRQEHDHGHESHGG
jgi:hypothetical protein